MGKPSESKISSALSRNDPGVTNDPRTSAGDFEGHIWSSLNQIFERLGKMDQKLDQLTKDQDKLTGTVEKHDKLILRVAFTVAGAIAILGFLWFLYDHFLKAHLIFK